MRRRSILAALALLALVTVPIADAAVAKPLMTVEGNVLVVFDPDATVTGITRFEIRTTSAGKVEFGYYEFQTLTGPYAGTGSKATVESVKFFAAPSGGKGAEFRGKECAPDAGNLPAWACLDYVVQVVDNAGRGIPDTLCGGEGCLYPFTVTGGDIRIFSQQQAQ